MDCPLTYESRDGVAFIRMDDGKANALGPAMIAALSDAFDDAASRDRAVVLTGREGRFCAGFDLEVMGAGADAATDLVRAGAELFMQVYTHPQPVVVACSGHALAGGAVLLLCADERIGASGAFKIGLNEVRIGIPVPEFITELAEARLERRALIPSTLFARIHDPEAAMAAGFLDQVVGVQDLEETALGQAGMLATLHAKPFASTKQSQRRALVERVRLGLEEDLHRFVRDFGG